jgi:hypothetical protein
MVIRHQRSIKTGGFCSDSKLKVAGRQSIRTGWALIREEFPPLKWLKKDYSPVAGDPGEFGGSQQVLSMASTE